MTTYDQRVSEPVGAWELRKLAAMREIQRVGMDLFDAQGYERVTVEAIAVAAAVSPSSVYRYFGTKEAIVLWDEHDRGLLASIATQLEQGTTLSAVAGALHRVGAGVDALDRQSRQLLRRRIGYIRREPAIWAAMHRQADEMAAGLREVLSRSGERPADSLELRVVAAAISSATLWAILTWAESDAQRLSELIEDAFRTLDQGLRFD